MKTTTSSNGRVLGILAGDFYARWCVQQMVSDVRESLRATCLGASSRQLTGNGGHALRKYSMDLAACGF
jgi:hypothetical protein